MSGIVKAAKEIAATGVDVAAVLANRGELDDKKQLVAKLLAYLGRPSFILPHLKGAVLIGLNERVRDPSKISSDRDLREIQLHRDNLDTILIYTAMESYHNGSDYDAYRDEVPVFDAFLDYAIETLQIYAQHAAAEEIKSEEAKQLADKARQRMKDMGLL